MLGGGAGVEPAEGVMGGLFPLLHWTLRRTPEGHDDRSTDRARAYYDQRDVQNAGVVGEELVGDEPQQAHDDERSHRYHQHVLHWVRQVASQHLGHHAHEEEHDRQNHETADADSEDDQSSLREVAEVATATAMNCGDHVGFPFLRHLRLTTILEPYQSTPSCWLSIDIIAYFFTFVNPLAMPLPLKFALEADFRDF